MSTAVFICGDFEFLLLGGCNNVDVQLLSVRGAGAAANDYLYAHRRRGSVKHIEIP